MGLWDKVFSTKPSQREFAEMVRREFEKAGSPGLEYREADFALKFPGKDTIVFLQNTYANYCSLPRGRRQEVVSRLIAGFTSLPEIPTDFASAKPHLMPVVRDAVYKSVGQLMKDPLKNDPGREWPCRQLVSELIVGLVYDTEHNIITVNQNKLNEWGVGIDETLKIAKENLWERTDPQGLTGKGGIYWGEWRDSYDSSRLLLTEFIYRLDVDGDPVASIPNRDALMVTGTRNTAGLRVVLNAGAETHFKSGHPLSPDLFVLIDGAWKLYIPEDPELQEIWRSTRRKREAVDYAQQKKLLEQLPELKDVFVANVMLFKGKDEREFSVCVWTKGVDSLLPRAEFVGVLMDPESKDKVLVRWEDVVSVAGNLMEQEPSLAPPRFRVRQFPSEEQVAALRRLAK